MTATLKNTLAIGTVTTLILLVHPRSVAATPPGDEEFARELQTAKTAKEVEALVNKASERLGHAIAKLESLLVEDIRRKDRQPAFVIAEITPNEKGQKGSLTLKEHRKAGAVGIIENPGDSIPIDLGLIGISGLQAKSGSRWIPNVFSEQHGGIISPTGDVPGADGSIHRYSGAVAVSDNYIFLGEGERSDRLTFALVKGIGYVYLRGTGNILILKDRKLWKAMECKDGSCKEIKLPAQQQPKAKE